MSPFLHSGNISRILIQLKDFLLLLSHSAFRANFSQNHGDRDDCDDDGSRTVSRELPTGMRMHFSPHRWNDLWVFMLPNDCHCRRFGLTNETVNRFCWGGNQCGSILKFCRIPSARNVGTGTNRSNPWKLNLIDGTVNLADDSWLPAELAWICREIVTMLLDRTCYGKNVNYWINHRATVRSWAGNHMVFTRKTLWNLVTILQSRDLIWAFHKSNIYPEV